MGENHQGLLDFLLCLQEPFYLSNFSEMSSGPPRILLNADPPGPATLALKTKEAALLRR